MSDATSRGGSAGSGEKGKDEPPSPANNRTNANNTVTNGLSKDQHEALKRKQSLSDRAKALWAKTGITWPIYKLMFKGAIAPTIVIAAYQSDTFSSDFTTVGYLVAIMAILAIPISPRAKSIQTNLMNVIFTCFAAAVVTLALYCCVRARINSGGDGTPGHGGPGTSGLAASGAQTAPYNSSGSAVAGIWLMFLIYVCSTIRAAKPHLMMPSICAAILANVGMVYAPQFSTMAQSEAFIRKLLSGMLTGLGVGFGVSLFIFPVTSRTTVFRDISAYVGALRSGLKANIDYIHSLEETDMFTVKRTETARRRPERSPEAQVVKAKMQAVTGATAKLNGDLPFAKREVALGYLGPDDLQSIARMLRMIQIPMVGLSCLSDIFDRIAEERGWDEGPLQDPSTDHAARSKAVTEWHELTRLLREPFQEIADLIDQGLEHALISLRLSKPKATTDEEAKGSPKPGDKDFAAFFDKQTKNFHRRKETMLTAWCHVRGIELPKGFFTDAQAREAFQDPAFMKLDFDDELRLRSRRQLFICLYMEFLHWSIARRVNDFITWTESEHVAAKLQRKRLIVPGAKRLKKWLLSLVQPDPDTHENQQMEGNDHMTTVYLGSAYSKKKDPMHLPPQNAWEKAGDRVRKAAGALSSPASIFGLRVAIATMCIAVVAYLRDTQSFYTRNRLFWAQIMVTIGMQPTSGQSLRNTILRIIATCLFMFAAWICWYIVDGRVAGVIVFFWVFMHLGPWIMIRFPAYTTIGIVGTVTMTIIIGYELQVLKIGIATATSNGQAYYPVYELGPIRLATVIGGLFLGWIWTIIPYPISEHAQQRKSLGSSLYLLANYYSVLHETVRARLRGLDDDPNIKGSVSHRLEKARHTIFGKCNLVLSGMRARTGFIKFDIPVGGKFPRKKYEDTIEQMQSTVNFMALVSYASTSFNDMQARNDDEENQSQWLTTFRKLIGETNVTSQSITTLLSLMSASVANSQPLPPYLRVPEPYQYSKKLDEMDRDLLSVRHIAEPGYASFAVIQLGTKCIIDDLKKLLASVKDLVGELDFSYHVVSTADADAEASEETLTYRQDHAMQGTTKPE